MSKPMQLCLPADGTWSCSAGLPSTDRQLQLRGVVPGGSTATSYPKACMSCSPDPPAVSFEVATQQVILSQRKQRCWLAPAPASAQRTHGL